jgi:phage terminase small subunit
MDKLCTRRTPGLDAKRTKKGETLNEKQLSFVEAYVESGNATQAALVAGYAPRTAAAQGCTQLKKPYVKEAIARRVASLRRETEIRGRMTKEWILEQLRGIASVDPADFLNASGSTVSLKDLSTVPVHVRRTIQAISGGKYGPSVKTADRIRALDLAASVLGYKTDKHEISGPGGSPIQIYLPDNEKKVQEKKPQPDESSDTDDTTS